MSTMQGGSGGTIIQEFLAADTYIIRGTQYTHTHRDMPHAAQAASFLTQFWVPLFHIGSRLHACSSARCATDAAASFCLLHIPTQALPPPQQCSAVLLSYVYPPPPLVWWNLLHTYPTQSCSLLTRGCVRTAAQPLHSIDPKWNQWTWLVFANFN